MLSCLILTTIHEIGIIISTWRRKKKLQEVRKSEIGFKFKAVDLIPSHSDMSHSKVYILNPLEELRIQPISWINPLANWDENFLHCVLRRSENRNEQYFWKLASQN